MDTTNTTYSIRKRVFTMLGAAFEIFDAQERSIGFCRQKAFRLKEDIRVYVDESESKELLRIATQQVIDFSASYDIVDAEANQVVGRAQRKGFSSLFRDSWELTAPDGSPVGRLIEDSQMLALLRRVLSNLIPQAFRVESPNGEVLARLKVRFNPFVYRMDVQVVQAADPRLILGVAILVAAIEGRQD